MSEGQCPERLCGAAACGHDLMAKPVQVAGRCPPDWNPAKTIPSRIAGTMSSGRLLIAISSGEREGDRQNGADRAAVDGERSQPVGLEEAQEEPDREVGGPRGAEGAHQRLATDV